MKANLLFLAVAAVSLTACKSVPVKSVEQSSQDKIMQSVHSQASNGLTRIQRGSDDYGFVLDVDAGDSDIEIVMIDESAEDYLNRLKLDDEGFVDPKVYLKKEDLDLAVSYLLKAQTLAYSQEYIASLELVERALLIAPTSAQALSIRGSIMLQLGKTAKAKEAWTEALSYDPSLTEIKSHLEAIN